MDLAAVMDGLGSALDTIPGLRVTPYWDGDVNPPAAIVGWPDEFDYNTTFQSGSQKCEIPVVVMVGNVSERSSRDQLAQYVATVGGHSVKQAIEGWPSATPWDSVWVSSVQFGAVTVAGVVYLAATFNVKITGRGA